MCRIAPWTSSSSSPAASNWPQKLHSITRIGGSSGHSVADGWPERALTYSPPSSLPLVRRAAPRRIPPPRRRGARAGSRPARPPLDAGAGEPDHGPLADPRQHVTRRGGARRLDEQVAGGGHAAADHDL